MGDGSFGGIIPMILDCVPTTGSLSILVIELPLPRTDIVGVRLAVFWPVILM